MARVNKGRKQVCLKNGERFSSLTCQTWYNVVAEDLTCYKLVNNFGNECRYNKYRFDERFLSDEVQQRYTVEHLEHAWPAEVKYVDIPVKVTRVVFADAKNSPWKDSTGASKAEYNVVDETEGYFFLEIPQNGKTIVAPYRKELLLPVGMQIVGKLETVTRGALQKRLAEVADTVRSYGRSEGSSWADLKPADYAEATDRGIHSVVVTFDGNSKYYHYLSRFLPEVGDRVIVDSPSSGYVAVTVKRVYPNSIIHPASKYLVSRVDDSEYKVLKEKQKSLDTLKASIATLSASMRQNIPEATLRRHSRKLDELCERRDLLELQLSDKAPVGTFVGGEDVLSDNYTDQDFGCQD